MVTFSRYPTGGYEVPPGTDPRPDRNDLMTDRGPRPGQPPAANIPASPRREARKAESFPLVDAQGRGANLPQAKLVLVEFFTTASATCRRAVPTLNDVHKRYAGRGVEVVGLACDDEPLKARVMAADQFQSDLDVAYTLLTEPGKRPGEWMTRYGVAELPTAVLLDDTGAVLWQGNPAKADDLRAAIEAGLRGK